MENPIKMDDLEGTIIFRNIHLMSEEIHGFDTWIICLVGDFITEFSMVNSSCFQNTIWDNILGACSPDLKQIQVLNILSYNWPLIHIEE